MAHAVADDSQRERQAAVAHAEQWQEHLDLVLSRETVATDAMHGKRS